MADISSYTRFSDDFPDTISWLVTAMILMSAWKFLKAGVVFILRFLYEKLVLFSPLKE